MKKKNLIKRLVRLRNDTARKMILRKEDESADYCEGIIDTIDRIVGGILDTTYAARGYKTVRTCESVDENTNAEYEELRKCEPI